MPFSGSLDRLAVLFSTSAADAVMNTDGAAAFPAAPLIALVGKEDLQPLFPDIPYILKRRLTEGILGCVAVLLFHHVCAGKIRALVAEPVSVLPAFPTQDNAAASGAELRFVLVRTVAARAGPVFAKCAGANAAVQSARSHHISCKHSPSPLQPSVCQVSRRR